MRLLKLADHACPYFIWVERGAGERWSWELIDRNGETAVAGAADDRDMAFQAALWTTEQMR